MRAFLILSFLLTGCPADSDDSDTQVVETDGTEAGTDGTEADTDPPDPCTDLVCGNGECIADGADASCDCDDGWEGEICDVDVDECEASPCAHGATCANTDGSFTCDCAPGWDGELCDLNIDDCPSAECGNGTCVDGIDAFTCDCDAGWEGQACDDEIDECEGAPCANAIQCVDQVNAFTCVCEEGWDGDLCEGNIDECADAPCDQGECIDGIAEVTCDCDAGFDGELCDNNIDDCEGVDACTFGDCVDGVADFTCDCEDGWQGEFCDEDINECDADDVCAVDAVCNNGMGTFSCDPVAMVDPNRATSGDGSSWELAYASVQDAVNAGEIALWVKEGTLTPAGGNTPVLVAVEGLTVLGGFSSLLADREGSADTRDASVRSVFSGEYGIDAQASNHVVVGASGMTLDGVVLRDGRAGSGSGGGLRLIGVNDVTLSNVVIEDNVAGVSGGGVYCENSLGLLLIDTVIDGNIVSASGATAGGGIASVSCSADLVRSEVTHNQAVSSGVSASGGGLWLQGSDWVLDDVFISENQATGGGAPATTGFPPIRGRSAYGGGVHLTGSPTAAWTDVVFSENSATGGRGGQGAPRLCLPIGGCIGTGRGGDGGEALGGGLFVSPITSLTFIGGASTDNVATGGAGGVVSNGSGPVGATGRADGGALYVFNADVDFDMDGVDFLGNVPNALRPCPAGFDGYMCEVDVDDCADDPCANAECSDAVDAFICDCDPGWEGTLCDVDIDVDDCTPDACAADRVCIDAVNSFTCEAPVFVSPGGDGTTGDSWETSFTSLTAAFEAGATGVWMKDGTYTAGADADVWIDVPGKARVFGGFPASLTGQEGDVLGRSGVSIVDGASRVQHVVQMGRGSVIDGLQIQGGSGARTGGGVLIVDADRVVLRNSTVRANSVTGDQVRGAGVYCDRSTEVSFDDVLIESNTATGGQIVGGGMALFTCTGSLSNSRIANNTVSSNNNASGIGLALVQGTFNVSDTVFEGNVGTGGQGATGGYGSLFPIPRAGGGGGQALGGGAYVDSVEPMVWSAVTFQGNRLTGGPGGTGAATQDGPNCFDAGNGGTGGPSGGGAMYVTATSDMTLQSGLAQNNVLVAGVGGSGGAGLTCGTRVGAPGSIGAVGMVTGGAVFATDSATVALDPVAGNTEPQLDLSR